MSFKPVNYNFSESTSLSECLIVAKKVKQHTQHQYTTFDHEKNEETTFVIVLNKPRTSIEAIALANSINAKEGNYVEAGQSRAFLISVDRDELLENVDNWGRFVFLPNIELLDEIKNLLGGNIKVGNLKAKIPLGKFNDLIATIGVDRHRFMDTFKIIDKSVPGSVRMLYGGEEAQRLRMQTLRTLMLFR